MYNILSCYTNCSIDSVTKFVRTSSLSICIFLFIICNVDDFSASNRGDVLLVLVLCSSDTVYTAQLLIE